jgi:hypothetical protein
MGNTASACAAKPRWAEATKYESDLQQRDMHKMITILKDTTEPEQDRRFDDADEDQSGELSQPEVQRWFYNFTMEHKSGGSPQHSPDWAKGVARALAEATMLGDTDGNGEISYEEFCLMLTGDTERVNERLVTRNEMFNLVHGETNGPQEVSEGIAPINADEQCLERTGGSDGSPGSDVP